MHSPPRVASTAAPKGAVNVALPIDVLVLVLQPLKGDVSSLCAAACVARAWCDAAALPALWARIGPLPPAAAAQLTDARLERMVARARGGLQHLDLSTSRFEDDAVMSCVTVAGLVAALRHESQLLSFVANGDPLTGAGIAAALASCHGRVQHLDVCGVRALAAPAGGVPRDERAAFRASCKATLKALRALLAPGRSLGAVTICARLLLVLDL